MKCAQIMFFKIVRPPLDNRVLRLCALQKKSSIQSRLKNVIYTPEMKKKNIAAQQKSVITHANCKLTCRPAVRHTRRPSPYYWAALHWKGPKLFYITLAGQSRMHGARRGRGSCLCVPRIATAGAMMSAAAALNAKDSSYATDNTHTIMCWSAVF